jgi:uncharacterized membrane protein YedE/YeeE
MSIHLFSSPTELVAGLITGVFFGFILQKANVTRFSTIVDQLLLRNFTVMKVIMTAIAVGSFGLYTLKYYFFDAALIISSTTLLSAAIGGGIFGIGMAVLGYCPGTCVGALAEKAKDAWFGIIGMIFGAGIYAEIFTWIKQNIKPDEQISKTTLAQYFGISPWVFILMSCAVVACFLFADAMQKNGKRKYH